MNHKEEQIQSTIQSINDKISGLEKETDDIYDELAKSEERLRNLEDYKLQEDISLLKKNEKFIILEYELKGLTNKISQLQLGISSKDQNINHLMEQIKEESSNSNDIRLTKPQKESLDEYLNMKNSISKTQKLCHDLSVEIESINNQCEAEELSLKNMKEYLQQGLDDLNNQYRLLCDAIVLQDGGDTSMINEFEELKELYFISLFQENKFKMGRRGKIFSLNIDELSQVVGQRDFKEWSALINKHIDIQTFENDIITVKKKK